MKRRYHIVVILTFILTYCIGKRVLDLMVWREIEREIRLEGEVMKRLVEDAREIGRG